MEGGSDQAADRIQMAMAVTTGSEFIADSSSGETVHRRELDQRFATLKYLMDERSDAAEVLVAEKFKALERVTDERFRAAREALEIAAIAQDKRLDGMNEIRKAMSDQAATSTPRALFDQFREAVGKDVATLREAVGKRDAIEQGQRSRSTDQRASLGAIVSLIGGAVLVVTTVVGGITWINTHNGSPSQAEAVASKRMDDMLQRMDAFSQRINSLTVPQK